MLFPAARDRVKLFFKSPLFKDVQFPLAPIIAPTPKLNSPWTAVIIPWPNNSCLFISCPLKLCLTAYDATPAPKEAETAYKSPTPIHLAEIAPIPNNPPRAVTDPRIPPVIAPPRILPTSAHPVWPVAIPEMAPVIPPISAPIPAAISNDTIIEQPLSSE